jgi:hypothetical protein
MPRKRKIDGLSMQVMKRACATCPFVNGHKSGLTLDTINACTLNVATLQSQHLCHTADNKKLCRGGRDIMLRVLTAFRMIDKPTDAAFNAAMRKALKMSNVRLAATDWQGYQTPGSSVIHSFRYSASTRQLEVTFLSRKPEQPNKCWLYSDVDENVFSEMRRRLAANESVGSYFQSIKKTLTGAEVK